ncbi:glutathione synthase/RimK-type ligase-like ATP-grasp enzyme [Paraburkholderia sp. GAS333]|uniref:hypothetical protein n=1 Tax=Paraburkholderia sp. GAS333 TaxID=3156279 RepID=UPI003D252AD1
MILIIGSKNDPHVSSVLTHLSSESVDFVVLDPFGSSAAKAKFSLNAEMTLSIGTSVPVDGDVTSVWWRLKPHTGFPNSSAVDLYDYYFRQREWGQALEYLEDHYVGARWLNNRTAARKASNKLLQLKIAESIGFSIPRTLVTSDLEELLEFKKSLSPSDLLFKTFTPYANPDGKLAYAQILTSDELSSMRDSISSCPSLYQEYIEKAYELRVTVVGGDVYGAKICAADTKAARQDWRAGLFDNRYEKARIPEITCEKIFKMSHELGIEYGAYDFIVQPDGRIVFLEVNPFGQWLWLENQVDLPISRAIADWLRGR